MTIQRPRFKLHRYLPPNSPKWAVTKAQHDAAVEQLNRPFTDQPVGHHTAGKRTLDAINSAAHPQEPTR